jgi:3-dehydroquinate synthase
MHQPQIGPETLQQLAELLRNKAFTRVLLLVDENTNRYCYPLVKTHLPEHDVIQVKSGEENKNLATCETIWQQFTEMQLDRWAVLVNLGGGVIGDMGGFCAAVYKRGINFINVPTTLLAMTDASVGGKTGVDFGGFKNQLGIFKEPLAVFINPDFLKTLPARELKSGYAEMVKHWLISDAEMFKEQRYIGLFTEDWSSLIEHSVTVKSKIVEQDPLEGGLRKVLNFGHTVGHAVESYLLDNPDRKVLHGEAIAVGMICESYLSVKKELLLPEELDKIETFLISVFEKIKLNNDDVEAIARLTLQDKKNSQGAINCTLLNGIGKAIYDQPVTLSEIAESLRYYQLL